MNSNQRQHLRKIDLRRCAEAERRLERLVKGALNKQIRHVADVIGTHGTINNSDVTKYDSILYNALYKQALKSAEDFYGLTQSRLGIPQQKSARTYGETYARSRAGEALQEINDTTLRMLRQLVANAIRDGLTITELRNQIVNTGITTNRFRANTIARTEVHRAMTNGSLRAAQDAPFETTKTWVARLDERTRSDHVVADGQTVDVNLPFSVGGHDIMVPGEGPPEQSINCRCTVVYQPT